MIGMIPEGLYLLASVAMAVSAMRLAKQKVLLHDMKSIETLARVNVLCVDKTGSFLTAHLSALLLLPVSVWKFRNPHLLHPVLHDILLPQ